MTGPVLHDSVQSATVSVPGADCSWCFNEAIEHLLQLDGVDEVGGSITSGCLVVTGRGFSTTSVLDSLRTYLHGTDDSSHECEMTSVEPHLVMPGEELTTAEIAFPGSGRRSWPMETVIEAMRRLRAEGYVHDLQAAPGGQLRCQTCGALVDPESVTVTETIRFEGESNPDDEAIVFAIDSRGGCLGQYSAAFGSSASVLDVEVLKRLTDVAGI